MPNFKQTIDLLNEFTVLPQGWHYGEGSSLPSDKVETAKLWITFFKVAGFSRFNAFPGLSNEIRLRVYHNDLMLEVFFETDNSIDIAIERGKELLRYVEAATSNQIRENINYFINNLCLMSVPSITDTSTLKKTNSQPNSLVRGIMAAFRSSTTNARFKTVKKSVGTLTDSTPLSPQARHHTTSFQMERFLQNVGSEMNHPLVGTSATEMCLVGTKGTSVR